MKRVQLAGGTFDVEGYLVGLERELRIDVSNDSIRLHDGTKEGGYEFQNKDSADARYQQRSLELDGFKFGAQEKGFLVRVSPSTYRLRKFTSVNASLTVANPRGTGGDIDIVLNPIIPTDHTTTGQWIFANPITAQGGVAGNLTGDVVGDLVGDSTGSHTGPVVGNAVGNHSGSFTGDVDVRGSVIQFDSGQIPLDALGDDVDAAFVSRGIPYGGIIMWAGAVADIPDSWALCNGENGTPNLLERFILGAGGVTPPGTLGGSASSSGTGTMEPSGAHTHTITVGDHALTLEETPQHKHGSGVCDAGSNCFNHGSLAAVPTSPKQFDTNSGTGTTEGYTTTVGGNATHTHLNSAADEGGEHTHEITLDSLDLKPPYYALCFIMKIA